MKLKIALLLIGLVLGSISHAQIKIGTNPQNINASSVLELESTSRALVLTRVNSTQMNAIRPLQGALVYNTETKCVHYYDGTQWLNICDALTNSVNISLENNGDGSYTFTDALGVQTTFTITSNATFEVANDSLVLTDSNNNALSVALDSLNRHTYSTDAIVNVFTINNNTVTNDSTIVIRRTGNNYNFEVGEISGLNIRNESITRDDYARGSINGLAHIQAASILQSNLATGSVGSAQILANSITLPKLAPGTIAGQLMQWNGSNWVLVDQSTLNITESDGIVGNEVLDATDNTLVRSGTGTTADPYTLDVSTGGINTPDIAANAIGTPQLANNAVNSDIILDGEVRTTDILNETILSEDILNGTIASVDIADDAVTAAKINIDVVGTGLIQNATTGALEVDPTAITGDGNITSTDINVTGGTGAAFNDVTLTINDDAVTANKILDANVTNAKLDKANISLTGFATPTADLSIGTFKLTDVVDPTIAQDAATKNYVDNAISGSNTLASTNIFVGDAANTAQPVTLAGDASIDNTGALTIANDAVTTDKIANANVTDAKLDKANISLTGFAAPTADLSIGTFKLTDVVDPTIAQDAATKNYVDNAISGSNTLTDANIFVGDATNTARAVTLSGDATIANNGNITIANNAVTANKILDANVTNAKLDKANISLSGFAVPTADLSIGSFKLTNVVDPLAAQDAATKNYVDTQVSNSNTLADANIFVGDAANTAQPVVLSGDATIDNTGALTIANNAVTTTKIANANVTDVKLDKANISLSGFAVPTTDLSIGSFKLTNVVDPLAAQDAATKNYVDTQVSNSNTLADANIFVGDAANTAQPVVLSGDATIDNTGALTIANNAVTTTKIANANVSPIKIEPSATNGQVLKTQGGTVAWANQFHAIGKINTDGTSANTINAAPSNIGLGNYQISFATAASSANYVIQLTLGTGPGREIRVTAQTINGFTIQITDSGNFSVDSNWYFTVTDF